MQIKFYLLIGLLRKLQISHVSIVLIPKSIIFSIDLLQAGHTLGCSSIKTSLVSSSTIGSRSISFQSNLFLPRFSFFNCFSRLLFNDFRSLSSCSSLNSFSSLCLFFFAICLMFLNIIYNFQQIIYGHT
jgi:hypothetical protein